MTSDSTPITDSSHELLKDSVGTLEVAALCFAGLAPTMAMALGTQFAAIQAGAATPLSYLGAMFGSLALTYVVVVFSRRVAASGVAFTWVGAVFGKNPGFLAGWLYASGWVFGAGVVLVLASLSLNVLFLKAGINIHWYIFFVILLAIAASLTAYGVRPSLRATLGMELVSVLAVALVALWVVIRGGDAGNSLAPFNPANSASGWGGIGFGMIYGFSAFAGFEAGTSLGLESRNPRRTIPRAVLLAVLISAGFYVFVTYALSIGYGVSHAAAWAGDSTPLDTLASRYTNGATAAVIDVMVVVSAFSAGMGNLALATRVFYGMARNRLAPEWVARTHPKAKTPYIAIFVAAVVTLIMGTCVGLIFGSNYVIGLVSGTTTLAFIAIYVTICVAAIWAFGRKSSAPTDLVVKVGLPIVAIVLLGFSFYSSFNPVPPFPYNLAGPLVILWGLIGVVFAYIQRRRGVTPTLDIEDVPLEVASETAARRQT